MDSRVRVVNVILECIYEMFAAMMCTADLDMDNSADPSNIGNFLNRVAWAICSTYYAVLKATLGAASFGWDMLFDILFIANKKN